jgi:hypothetical protein
MSTPESRDEAFHVAMTDKGCALPSPLNVEWNWHVASCLHAIGATFAWQSIDDAELNALIDAIENELAEFPLETARSLLRRLKRLDWRAFIADVADMHGDMARGWYRKTALWVIEGLTEAVGRNQARHIRYVRFGVKA